MAVILPQHLSGHAYTSCFVLAYSHLRVSFRRFLPKALFLHSPYMQVTSADFFIQVVEDGYEFFAKRQLVTLFSAPNYCGEFDNAGAMMSVDETLLCSFQVRCPFFPCALFTPYYVRRF
jgi:hypothetical protein